MTREELDFIGSMNMFDEISNEAYKKIVCHCEEQEPCEDAISRKAVIDTLDNMDKALDTERTVEEYKALLIECYKALSPVKAKKTEPSGWIPHKMNFGIHEYIYAQCPICESTHDVKSKYCPSCGNLNGLEWIEEGEENDNT